MNSSNLDRGIVHRLCRGFQSNSILQDYKFNQQFITTLHYQQQATVNVIILSSNCLMPLLF